MQHTWTEFKDALEKLNVKSWQDISERLNVPRKTIFNWAVDNDVPHDIFSKLGVTND